jgi:uncharacterized membrane protein (UPF0127 family)
MLVSSPACLPLEYDLIKGVLKMKAKHALNLALTITFCLTVISACNDQNNPPPEPVISPPVGDRLSTTRLNLAGEVFTVELASTNAARAQGLMFRENIPDNTGMLFIHSKSQVLSYWMKNCLIDMDILYIKEDGAIAAVYTMTVLPDPDISDWEIPGYSSEVPVKYALELPAGAAEKLNLTPGKKIKIPTAVTNILVEPDNY